MKIYFITSFLLLLGAVINCAASPLTSSSKESALKSIREHNNKRKVFDNVYGDWVSFSVDAPESIMEGKTFTVIVQFIQDSSKYPYIKNTDMDKEPYFPNIDGCELISGPSKNGRATENKDASGKINSKTYITNFAFTLRAKKPGITEISNVRLTYRGYSFTANSKKILIEKKPYVDPGIIRKYNYPFFKSRSTKYLKIDSVVISNINTLVYLNYRPATGVNFSLSSEYYIEDNNTNRTYKLSDVYGISTNRHFIEGNQEYKFSLEFPPLPESCNNIDIIEPVENGFTLTGVELKEKKEETEILQNVKKGVFFNSISWDNVKNVIRINNYDSDFKITNGMLPIYNRDVQAWGFFNEEGKLVIPFKWKFDSYGTPHFDNGHCMVALEGKRGLNWFIIDKSGNRIALPSVVKVSNFQDGYATVIKKVGKAYQQVIINTKGVAVFPHLNQYIGSIWSSDVIPLRPFQDGLAAYYDRSKQRWGFINKAGKIVIAPQFFKVEDFSEGMAAVATPITSGDLKWGFIDTTGNMVIPANFTHKPFSFKTGRASVKKRNGDWVMINKKGEIISPDYYQLFPCLSNGNTIARIATEYYLLDRNYNIISEELSRFDFDKAPFKEMNGVFLGQISFGPQCLFYSDGRDMIGGIDNLSENLIHFKLDNNKDAFMDYNGNIVFYFDETEF